MRTVFAVATFVLFAAAVPSRGQESAADIEARLTKLRRQVDELEQKLATLRLKGTGRKAEGTLPRNFKVGDLILLDRDRNDIARQVRVQRVTGPQEMTVVREDNRDFPFIIRGRSTKGIADDQLLDLTGIWQVTGVHRPEFGRSMFVVEPIGSPAKK